MWFHDAQCHRWTSFVLCGVDPPASEAPDTRCATGYQLTELGIAAEDETQK